MVYELVPAHTDERVAAETVLYYLSGCDILGDKSFVGQYWQAEIYERTGNRIWTPKRRNQQQQNSSTFERWLVSAREWVTQSIEPL